jgi:hypothetical protein
MFTHEHPVLKIGFLRKHGLLGKTPAVVKWRWPGPTGEHARAVWSPSANELTITAPGVEEKVLVDRGQGRVAFICPMTQHRCNDLYLIADKYGSRQAHALGYFSKTLSPLERELQTRKRGGRASPVQGREPVWTGGQTFGLALPDSERRAQRLSTVAALDRGEDLMRQRRQTLGDDFPAVEQNLVQYAAATRVRPLARTQLKSGLVEEHPRLEMLALRNAGTMVGAVPSTRTARWKDQRTDLDWAWICVDAGNPEGPRMTIHSVGMSTLGEKDIWLLSHRRTSYQTIKLTERDRSPSRLRRFICPSTGLPVKVLLYRDGRWASAKAQNLVNASQRSDRFREHDARGYRDTVRPPAISALARP